MSTTTTERNGHTSARNVHTSARNGQTADHSVELTAHELYEAEIALHDARQTESEAWIKAAADHLHAAVERHLNAIEGRI